MKINYKLKKFNLNNNNDLDALGVYGLPIKSRLLKRTNLLHSTRIKQKVQANDHKSVSPPPIKLELQKFGNTKYLLQSFKISKKLTLKKL